MSLVNYSSDEDEEEEEEEEEKEKQNQQQLGVSLWTSSHPSSSKASSAGSSLAATHDAVPQTNFSVTMVDTSLQLPDASQLLASFDSVGKDMVVNVSTGSLSTKKRSDLNGSAAAPLKKIPKGGGLMPVRVVSDTAGGSLLPPQLRGRSNVATEDLDKLFTRKSKNQ